MVEHKNIGILLLAAGSSSRLGQPKQLVKINHEILIEYIINSALATPCNPIVIVLGAHYQKIKPLIEHHSIYVLVNKNWEKGMGSTIACGMDFIIKNFPNLKAVILLVCDQYKLSEKDILKLITIYEKTEKNIIASKYGNTIGVPALFSKNIFQELIKLNSHQGAKNIINQYKNELATIDFPEGISDLDTKEDLEKLIGHT